jgi:excisionase family DNA binding protein
MAASERDALLRAMPDEYLTVEEVAALMRCSADTVRRLLKEGRMDGSKVGTQRGWRIHREEAKRVMREGPGPVRVTIGRDV